MKKTETIRVCKKGLNYGEPGELITIIRRVPWFAQIGNFSPMFCRYDRKRCLVQSEAGDLSDPFRREASYRDSFFIEINN